MTVLSPIRFLLDENADYGPCVLTVVVSDGTLSSTGSIQINITADPDMNLAPIVYSAFQSANLVSANGKIRYIIRARDPEGTDLTFAWSAVGGTMGTQSDTVNGLDHESTIDWTAPASGTGNYVITVTITDVEGLTNIFSFQPVLLQ